MKEWNANMRRALIISLLAVSMLLTGMICALDRAVYAAVDPKGMVPYASDYYFETEGGKIFLEHIGYTYYLFLPGEADTEYIIIKTGKNGEKIYFKVDDSEIETLDLSGKVPGALTYIDAVIRDASGAKRKGLKICIIKGSGIGTVYYTSDDPDNRGRSWIEESQKNRGSGSVMVFDAEGRNLTEDAKNQVVEDIHGRGYSSWSDPKKSYQIKFDKKISLIDGAGKEKKWILLAQYKDPLHMSDIIAKKIASRIRENYSPKATWVNFYYDGEYRGVYELSEKNEIKSSRIDINDLEEEYEEQDPEYGNHLDLKTDVNKYGNTYRYQDGLTGPEEPGGFLIEMNSTEYDENNGFKFRCPGERAVNMKSPDLGSKEFVKYVSEYFQEFCDAVSAVDENGVYTGKNPNTGKYFYEYCDYDSLVDTYLVQSLLSDRDSFHRSQYFYKDRGGIMISGPIWDFDLSIGTGWSDEISPERDYLAGTAIMGSLIQNKDFRKRVSRRYLEAYSTILESLINTGGVLPTFKAQYNTIRSDLAMDTILWPEKYKCGNGSLRWSSNTRLYTILDYRVDWLKRHKAFLDDYFQKMAAEGEESHDFEYKDNGNGTHTGTCRGCLFKQTEDHTWDGGSMISRATTTKAGTLEYTCTLCGAAKQEEIPKVKQADITINVGTVTVASVKDVIEKVDAAGGTTNAVILGKKVKKISKGAFKSTGIKTITLKTVSLKDKSVKGSLTGSTVSSVKVKVGGAGKNKKYVKQYKKIFTKKNAGRKVKVS